MKARVSRLDIRANFHKLPKLVQDFISKYILDKDSGESAPRLASVEDIAN